MARRTEESEANPVQGCALVNHGGRMNGQIRTAEPTGWTVLAVAATGGGVKEVAAGSPASSENEPDPPAPRRPYQQQRVDPAKCRSRTGRGGEKG